jgi:hypothetical protein
MRQVFTALLLVSVAIPAAAAPASMQAAARRFLTNFAAGRFDAAASDFNEQMKATVTPQVLARQKEQFDRDFGRFRWISSLRETTEAGFPVIELTAQFEKAPALVQVAFDADRRIGALHFNRVASNNPELERMARRVLDDFNARRFDEIEKYLDMKMSAQLPPSALDALYTDVTAVYGNFKAVTEVHYLTQRDLRIVNIIAAYEKMPLLFEVVFNNAGRITGWSFRPPK